MPEQLDSEIPIKPCVYLYFTEMCGTKAIAMFMWATASISAARSLNRIMQMPFHSNPRGSTMYI